MTAATKKKLRPSGGRSTLKLRPAGMMAMKSAIGPCQLRRNSSRRASGDSRGCLAFAVTSGAGPGMLDRDDVLPESLQVEQAGRRLRHRGREERHAGRRLDPAPRAIGQAGEMPVCDADGAFSQVARQDLERVDPFHRRRPAAPRGATSRRRARRARRHRRRHGLSVGARRRSIRGGVPSVGEPELPDRPLDRHLASPQVAAGEGMPAHEQQLEDQHRQTEIVVVLRAHRRRQRRSLQLRRREGRDADLARESAGRRRDLEAVAVDQPDRRVLGHQDAAVVDVADDAPVSWTTAKARARLAAARTRKRQSARGNSAAAALRAVELVDSVAIDPRHQQPRGAPPGRASSSSGQAPATRAPVVRSAGHGGSSWRLVAGERPVVDLGDELGRALDLVDRALATLPDPAPEADRAAPSAQRPRHGGATDLRGAVAARVARISVLSSSVRARRAASKEAASARESAGMSPAPSSRRTGANMRAKKGACGVRRA